MGEYFSHEEVFPSIARFIARRYRETGRYVPHDDIAAAMLGDPEVSLVLDRGVERGSKQDRRQLASTMIAWFSQQVTTGKNEWAPYFDRTKIGGRYAYRPITAVDSPAGEDVDLAAVEGEPRLVSHLRRERNRRLAEARKQQALALTGSLACEACGFDFRYAYPGLALDFCEVHHNRPLSEAGTGAVTRLEDLAILCSNCHRMIHKTTPLATVAEFRKLLRAAV